MAPSPSHEPMDELLKQLTLEEKVALTSGHTNWRTPAVPRLGIKAIKTSDGPNGCRGESIHASTKASCFPCGACMGATWNVELMQEVGKALAKEAKLKNVGVLLGPTINIHRHPYGGRTFESFSEDAVLSGELAAAYVQGLQSQDVAACPKHFVCNECEVDRNNTNSIVDETTLRELYLAPFQICIRKSQPWSLMTAYNKLNGPWCSESPFLIGKVLRDEWKWEGCVMSDFGGVYSAIEPMRQGLNLEMPGPSIHRGQKAVSLVEAGQLTVGDVDKNAARVIELSRKVGMEDEHRPEQASPDPEITAVARQTAAEGIVLLKNKDSVLPIRPGSGVKVAVFGAPATSPIIHGGGSPSLSSHHVSTPLEALRAVYPDLRHCYGVPIFRKVPSAPLDSMRTAAGEPGVDCHWYNGWTFGENEILHERLERTRTLVIDPRIPGIESKHCSRMSCTLTPKTSGNHTFGVTASGETRIYVDGQLVVSHPGFTDTKVEYIMQPWRFEEKASLPMNAGQEYRLVIDTLSTVSPPPPPPAFQISPQATQVGFFENLDNIDLGTAEALASESDVSIIFTGNNQEWESESFDRLSLSLSDTQNAMIEKLAAVSKKTVVINQTGAAISMPWLQSVDAVLQNWLAGMQVGDAVADILSGKQSPSGRLPSTFPVAIEDMPAHKNFPADANLDIRYEEGLQVGYRAYTKAGSRRPMFPFGHGLSYASFQYSDLSVDHSESSDTTDSPLWKVSVQVENGSHVDAKEVVQLYIDGVLKAFAKVMIQAGQKQRVNLDLDKYAFGRWNVVSQHWEVRAGRYSIDMRRDALDVIVETEIVVADGTSITWSGL